MEEINKHQAYFNEFIKKIIENEDYKGAYEALYKNMKARQNHDYDNHLFLQFSLLRKILKDENLDFSFLEDGSILVTSEEYEEGSMYEIFVKFKYAVLKGDFREARKQIMDYELKEKRKRTNTKISTKLFVRLASAAARNSYKKEEEKPDKPVISKEEIALKYNENYRSFLTSLEAKKYEEALKYLTEASKYTNDYSSSKVNTMMKLLNDLIKVQSNQIVQTDTPPSYEDLGNDYKRILYRAINKKDYQTAYRNIGKCIYFDERNRAFKIYHTLLGKIVEASKKIKPVVTLEKEAKIKEEFITEEELLGLLENREYSYAKTTLEHNLIKENSDNDSRMNQILLKLLRVLEELKSDRLKLKTVQVEINEENIFETFVKSIEQEDYVAAYEYAKLCRIEEGNKTPENFEFLAYSYVLEDINLYSKIKQQTHQIALTKEDLETLKELYEQKIQIEGFDSKYNQYVLNVIDTFLAIDDCKGVFPSFKTIGSNETDLIKRFEEMMNQGDYPSAYQLIFHPDWMKRTKSVPYKDQIILIKKVLSIMMRKIKVKGTDQKLDLSMIETLEVISQLETLVKFIEEEDYVNAKKYIKENKIDGNPEFLNSLEEFLSFLSVQQLRESKEFSENQEKEKEYIKNMQY